MKRYLGYRLTIWVLAFIVVLQGIFIFIITRPKRIPKPKERPPFVVKGKIAIVIDDWGYNLNNLEIIKQIKYPLTAAVLPRLNYSKAIAEELHKSGKEVILHLPMEPHEKFRLEKNTILTTMDEKTIQDILSEDLADIYYAKGASNHMGSKATEDLRTMSIVFNALKERGLFFLDSFVTSESVCLELANKIHLKFSRRDVFLDNKEEPEYIKQQLYKLKTKARVYGQAVGIGHDRKITLEALKEILPQLEKEGYRFVFISELVK